MDHPPFVGYCYRGTHGRPDYEILIDNIAVFPEDVRMARRELGNALEGARRAFAEVAGVLDRSARKWFRYGPGALTPGADAVEAAMDALSDHVEGGLFQEIESALFLFGEQEEPQGQRLSRDQEQS